MSASPMTAPEIAKKLLEILGPNGEHWIQGAFAEDIEGNRCASESACAQRFCIAGAMIHENINCDLLRPYLPASADSNFLCFNDAKTTDWLTIKSWLEGIAHDRP